ncbi:putative F-box protein At5g55150 [Silene latifolia]|uniref:putative F-box protein At5g55150 n=1 Tax=Silene latifolia TaxID=37657 RepID=UPI003D786288
MIDDSHNWLYIHVRLDMILRSMCGMFANTQDTLQHKRRNLSIMAFTSRHSSTTSIPSTSSQYNQAVRISLKLSESTYYLLAPKERGAKRQKPWIARVEEDDPTTWRLLNPLCGITGLFDKAEPPIMGRMDDPSNYLIKELGRSYSLVDDHSDEDKSLEKKASKVIPLSASNTCMNQPQDLKLLAIDWDKNLYFWRQEDAYWTYILDDNGHRFEDIVSCRGKFYAADELGTFFEIDPTKSSNEDEFNKIISAPDIPEKNSDLYKELLMGEYEGQVHLLLRLTRNIIRAYVLEDGYGREPHRWNTVKSLNNNVLFILNEVSFLLTSNRIRA